jgi:hypothetical protein
MIGKLINKYRIDAKLGEGGMGLVYKAWDTVLERPVALKMMHASLAQDETFLQRFRAEAKAIAQLESPYIVAVHDLLETSEGLFIVMQYVNGETLADKIRREGAFALAEAVALCRQMLQALVHAHHAGVIHRDIKPGNVMRTEEGVAKVTDFGLAKVRRGSVRTLSHVTGGTLHYMPPEQIRNFAVADQRSDLYAVGMTLYEMLTGRLPFDKTEDLFALAKTLVAGKFPSPRRFQPNVPQALARFVMKALHKDARKRFQSANEMLETLTHLEQGQPEAVSPPTRSRRRLLYEIMGSLALVAVTAFFFLRTALGPRLLDLMGWAAHTKLTITTRPDSAAVRLNGKLLGLTPLLQRRVKAGTLDLLIQRKNYAEIDTPIVLQEDRPEHLSFVLAPLARPAQIDSSPTAAAWGAVEITAAPPGVAIIYKGERVAKTRYRNSQLAVGAHKFRLRHEGYHDSTVTLTVKRDETARAHLALRPRTAVLKISVHPYGSIYLDGALWIENTDQEQSRSVRVGKHKVRIEHPTLGRREREIIVKAEQANEVVFDLEDQ